MPIIDSRKTLDFERPIVELENKIAELKRLGGAQLDLEIRRLERKARQLQREVFAELSPWQKVLLSRHPLRPFTLDYVERLIEGFIELHGDRAFHDDEAIVGGVGRFAGRPVMVLGHQKGRGTKENIRRNFGQPKPEGYRKARRLMELASRLGLPILSFIDTPGAYPGIEAEERGQAEAIAKNLEVMSRLPVPIIATVIGEGGSGGASILWKDQKKVETAAQELKMTAGDLVELGVADRVLPEPAGGAHRDPDQVAQTVREAIASDLAELSALSPEARLEARYAKFRRMGAFLDGGAQPAR